MNGFLVRTNNNIISNIIDLLKIFIVKECLFRKEGSRYFLNLTVLTSKDFLALMIVFSI